MRIADYITDRRRVSAHRYGCRYVVTVATGRRQATLLITANRARAEALAAAVAAAARRAENAQQEEDRP